MPARRITRQEKQALSLEAAAFQFAPEVSASCENFWVSITPDGEVPPQTDEERILAIGRWLTAWRERSVEADDAHDDALRQRHQVVSDRDTAAGALRDKILEIRRNFEGVYGQGKTAKILDLVPNIDDEAVRLKRYARAAVKLMQKPSFELPAAPSSIARIDPAEVIAEITPFLENLEGFVGTIDGAKRYVQTTLKEKLHTAEKLEEANALAARYLEALFFLVGETFYAERLRQSSHVSPSTAEPAESGDDSPPGSPASGQLVAESSRADDSIGPVEVDDDLPASVAAALDSPVLEELALEDRDDVDDG